MAEPTTPIGKITSTNPSTGSRTKIGLALSGGGFRASIFHLGVIRRLEELGIMKDVDVISTVSGGSIIGAYYVCEMEKRLREHRDELKRDPSSLDKIRVRVFEEIADGFFHAIRHNMRSRALVFAPFFHPILFIKSLWPGVSRSDIIQKEYDMHLFDGSPLFYTGETVGDLPSVTGGGKAEDYLVGPELVINATSLLTGERVSFSRHLTSGIEDMKKVNANVLPLARAVGASASVPGLFPPTVIAGDSLVDGGVSDNQGIDGLLKEGLADGGEYSLIIVSDASGQIARADQVSPKSLSVLSRSMSIFQHEIRNMEIQKLVGWKQKTNLELGIKDGEKAKASFAFIHLFRDLKGRVASDRRVPSEYIPAIGRIRTDLDQFSMVEREALMYHAYTLIDERLSKHCEHFLESRKLDVKNLPTLHRPPLFEERARTSSTALGQSPPSEMKLDRRKIKRELVAGAKPLFVLRSIIKYPVKAGLLVAATWAIPIALFFTLGHDRILPPLHAAADWVVREQVIDRIPAWLSSVVNWMFGPSANRGAVLVRVATVLIEVAVVVYFFSFLTYVATRKCVLQWDRNRYQARTGQPYSVRWGDRD